MKKNLLIILLLAISLLSAFWATAQDSTNNQGGCGTIATIIQDNVPKLIADETWRTYTKTGAKIVTYSESVFKELSLRFGDRFNKITIHRKKDRHGEYKEYTLLTSAQIGAEITNWAKHNL